MDVDQITTDIFCISIHSLRVEGDTTTTAGHTVYLWISIHSLRVEGDDYFLYLPFCGTLFQSTPSVWRETICVYLSFVDVVISIHSLRVEGDCTSTC